MHVDEDLAERAVLVLAGAEEDLVPADVRFLREAAALRGQAHPLALGASERHRRGDDLNLGRGFGLAALRALLAGGGERLRGLAAVAVQGDRLEPELPALLVDLAHVVDRRVVRAGSRSCEIAPDRNGCTAAIIRTCDIGARKRSPVRPQRFAQSNTA